MCSKVIRVTRLRGSTWQNVENLVDSGGVRGEGAGRGSGKAQNTDGRGIRRIPAPCAVPPPTWSIDGTTASFDFRICDSDMSV